MRPAAWGGFPSGTFGAPSLPSKGTRSRPSSTTRGGTWSPRRIFLRKCPYHENFTKLTKPRRRKESREEAAAPMGVEGGGAFDSSPRKVELEPRRYKIKALTPGDYVYNTMDPRDVGRWAVLTFANPSVLFGRSLSVASDALSGADMARAATDCGAFGDGVAFSYATQPRWLFEVLAFVELTFVYVGGLQRWTADGGAYDLDEEGVERTRRLVPSFTWSDHLEREGLGQRNKALCGRGAILENNTLYFSCNVITT